MRISNTQQGISNLPAVLRTALQAGHQVVLASLALLFTSAFAQGEWAIPQAKLRFDVELQGKPTHAEAGYFLTLPDGGILPRPCPVTRVMASDGSELPSYALWWNQWGLSLVFKGPPGGGKVRVYVEPSQVLKIWKPASGLTPSAILCSDPESYNMDAARALAGLGRIGSRVRCWNYGGHPRAPLCVPGDLGGRPPPCSLYLLAHVVSRADGKTWIAPFTHVGTAQVRVDGTEIVPRERVEKWGGTGQYVDMSAGIHRVEVLAACPSPGTFARGYGVMWLTWAPANATIHELGGARPAGVPMPGTSKQASRVLRKDEVVRSGRCRVVGTAARDGGPVAAFNLRPAHTYLFRGERPVVRYELRAVVEGNPAGTEYTWRFGDDTAARGETVEWLFPGAVDREVSLTASLSGRKSQCARSFYTYSTMRTSLNRPADREAFRSACLTMLKASPPDADPTAGWDDSMWRNLFRVLEIGEGEDLLDYLFNARWDVVSEKLQRGRRKRLEDLFILGGAHTDPDSALKWIERLRRGAKPERDGQLQVEAAETLMYYSGDTNRLERAAAVLRPVTRSRDAAGSLAKVRFADVAFMAGNLNEAVRLYGEVQNAFRAPQPGSEEEPGSERGRGRVRERGRDRDALRGTAADRLTSRDERIADWKSVAVLDAAASEMVRSLIEQRYYEEALWELAAWEQRFPLSKVSGDFIILEAQVYIALGHHLRARRALEAYCRQVDASSYMAEAIEQLLYCMTKMGAPDNEMREFCEAMKKRLEFHPAVEQIDAMLRQLDNES